MDRVCFFNQHKTAKYSLLLTAALLVLWIKTKCDSGTQTKSWTSNLWWAKVKMTFPTLTKDQQICCFWLDNGKFWGPISLLELAMIQLGAALMGEGWIAPNSIFASFIKDVNICVIFKSPSVHMCCYCRVSITCVFET